MAESDHNMVIRNILANLQAENGSNSEETTDCVTQLLAAAVVQFGNTTPSSDVVPLADSEEICCSGEQNLVFNPNMTNKEDCDAPHSDSIRKKPICIKFPIELRKRIIAMRKEGKKCMEVAKELHISVSGAQKVWERFLATGMVHDKKPSTYAGRPRKYNQEQEKSLTADSVGENIEVYETIGDQTEFIESSASVNTTTPSNNDSEPPMIVTYTGNTSVFVEEALDVPGETVEIVETDPQTITISEARKQTKRKIPEYRQKLLMRLVQDCPLSTLKADPSILPDNPHITNLFSSINKPLYMEYILGHPFGKVPFPQPFDGSADEAAIIFSDPVDPIGKEMLASLGYSTKVYFNACCKPSPLFDTSKVLSSLPFSIGPGHLSHTMQAVLQLLLDFCTNPAAALERIPTGNGLVLVARMTEGVIKSQKFSSPGKLSDYWARLYNYASLLECCENFLSANKPSAPCLVCHPFESVVKTLEIKDEDISSLVCDTQTLPCTQKEKTDQQVEVQVLQSGQIQFSAPKFGDSSVLCNSNERTFDSNITASPSHFQQESTSRQDFTISKQQNLEYQTDNLERTTLMDVQAPAKNFSSHKSIDISTPTSHSSPIIESTPLILCRNRNYSAGYNLSTPKDDHTIIDSPDRVIDSSSNDEINQRQLRKRSSRRISHKRSDDAEIVLDGFCQNQPLSSDTLPVSKRKRSTLSVPECMRVDHHPAEWSIEEVVDFVENISHCNYANVFREHEVDGESMMNLDPEMMVKLMNVKAGPALKIHRHILELKKKYNIEQST